MLIESNDLECRMVLGIGKTEISHENIDIMYNCRIVYG